MSLTPQMLHEQLCELIDRPRAPSLKEVEWLIAEGASVNGKSGKRDETPLHLAAKWGHSTVIEALVKAGADLNSAQTTFGYTPLMVAAKNNRAEAVRKLLDLGADPCVLTQIDQYSALYLAAQSLAHQSLEVLLTSKAKELLETKSKQHMTPLLVVAEGVYGSGSRRPIWSSQLGANFEPKLQETLRLLLEAGADVTQANIRNQIPLELLAGTEFTECTKLLLAHHYSQDKLNAALSWAVFHGQLGQTKLLIEAGADVMLRYTGGETLMNVVAEAWGRANGASMAEIVKLLAEYDVDPYQPDDKGRCMLETAYANESPDEVKMALAELGVPIPAEAEQDPLFAARLNHARRLSEVMRIPGFRVSELTPDDVKLLGNIGQLDAAFSPSWWKGNEVALQQLIDQLPSPLVEQAMVQQAGLQQMLQPGTRLSEWSHEAIMSEHARPRW